MKTRLSAVIIGLSVAILGQMMGPEGLAADAVRVTTSFDSKYAGGVLRQVAKVYSAGFGQAEAGHVEQDINGLKADQPKVWQFSIQYKGKPGPLEIRALMDDLGMIDLDFATSAEAAPAVRAAVDGYLAGRGG
jgi:hypothetical protein